jgi:hypothetical protein
MLEILDGIIATGAVVLALSLIVQAIQQVIKQTFDLKSSYMRKELIALFGTVKSPAASEGIRKIIGNVVQSVRPYVGQLDQESADASQIVGEIEDKIRSFGYKDLELIADLDENKLKAIVKSLPMFGGVGAEDKLKKVIGDIETWFDVTKRAFQDHYERRMKYWALVLSTLIVLALNANVIEIYREFATQKSVREAAVTMGQRFLSVPRDSLIGQRSGPQKDTTVAAGEHDSIIVSQIKGNVSQIQRILSDNSFELFRWDRPPRLRSQTWFLDLLTTVLGWFGMALLVSLGAPFWYDLLKTLFGVKNLLQKKRGEPQTQ